MIASEVDSSVLVSICWIYGLTVAQTQILPW